MTAIELILQQPAAQAIGWALLQFVWQGALVGVLTACALSALRHSAADVRYVVATIGLSLMITMPIVTALQAFRDARPASHIRSPAASPATGADSHASGGTSLAPSVPGTFSEKVPATPQVAPISLDALMKWAPFAAVWWLCGVVLLSLRLMSGWVYVQRMKSHGVAAVGEGLQRTATRLMRHLHIRRRVTFLKSTIIDVPTVIGWVAPVVLLPASALAGLSPDQLEAILAHELAHIRRHDYLVNLLQTLVETLLFYHPAVWWLSRRIRIERENCCDDLAVSLCGDPVTYAQALADLEELRGAEGQLVVAASGGSLIHRVRRLLGAPSHAGRGPGWLAGAVAILLTAGIAAGAVGQETVSTPSTPSTLDQWPPAPPAPPAPAAPPTLPAPPAPADVWPGPSPIAPVAPEAPMPPDAPSVPMAPLPQLAPPAMPALPAIAPPAPVAPPAPPAPPANSQSISIRNGQESGNYSWSNNGEKLEVNYKGKVEFTDDDTDVKSLTPGGWLRIKDGGWFGGHAVEFRSDASGNIERRFWSGSSERPFDPEGRKWLTQVLPRFIRQTGIGAPARVARILKAKGTVGVLAEIGLVEGSWAKRIYFSELLKTPGLDARTVAQVLAQAGREIDSDFELASLLISADSLLTDDATRKAYFEAARTIGSDFEMRRVFSSALKNGPVSASVLAAVLDSSSAIEGDFEQASLLVQVAKLQPIDNTTRGAFFRALSTVEGDFEQRRVLSAVLQRTDLSPEVFNAVLEAVGSISSDFEAASALLQVVKQQPIEGSLRAPFFRAVAALSGSHERGRVLMAVAKIPETSDETILEVIRSAQGMGGSFETSQVLLAVAASHALGREGRDAYIDAAEKLGDFEQGRVLSALVKNERRK